MALVSVRDPVLRLLRSLEAAPDSLEAAPDFPAALIPLRPLWLDPPEAVVGTAALLVDSPVVADTAPAEESLAADTPAELVAVTANC